MGKGLKLPPLPQAGNTPIANYGPGGKFEIVASTSHPQYVGLLCMKSGNNDVIFLSGQQTAGDTIVKEYLTDCIIRVIGADESMTVIPTVDGRLKQVKRNTGPIIDLGIINEGNIFVVTFPDMYKDLIVTIIDSQTSPKKAMVLSAGDKCGLKFNAVLIKGYLLSTDVPLLVG